MSKRLPGMGVAEVQLHVGNRYPQQSIPQRNGGVGECAGIDQDPLARPNGLMDPFHKSPFEVALEALQHRPRGSGLLPQAVFDRCRKLSRAWVLLRCSST